MTVAALQVSGAGLIRGSVRPAPGDIAVVARRHHPDEAIARQVGVFVSRHRDRHSVLAIANTWGVSPSTVHRDFREASRLVRCDQEFQQAVIDVAYQ